MRFLKMLMLFSLSLIILNSCKDPTVANTQDEIPDLIPEVVFGEITARVIIDDTDSNQLLEAQYIGLAPILTSFKGNSLFKSGNKYSMPLFDSNMVFEIIPQSGGSTFYFKGIMEDGSGWLNVYYNQREKTFSYDQCIFADIPTADRKIIVYSDGTDIALDKNGYFHSLYFISYINYQEDDIDPPSWELAAMTAEIFRGKMNATGDVGTGISYYSDIDADYAIGTQEYTSPDGTGSDIPGTPPATLSIDNLVAWEEILSSEYIRQLDRADSTGYWEIIYKMDDGDVTRVSDDSKDENGVRLGGTLSGYQSGFTPNGAANPAREDLYLWGTSSLIIDLLN